jgi:hypothetical protein
LDAQEEAMGEVKWLKEVDRGLSLAKSEGKPVLLDFFNPG